MDLKETLKKMVNSEIAGINKGEAYYKKEIKKAQKQKYDIAKKIDKFSF